MYFIYFDVLHLSVPSIIPEVPFSTPAQRHLFHARAMNSISLFLVNFSRRNARLRQRNKQRQRRSVGRRYQQIESDTSFATAQVVIQREGSILESFVSTERSKTQR